MGRRLLALALALAAVLPASAAAPAKPMRIMSMNQCADLLLLQLVPRSRIVAVTYLAHEGAEAFFPGADAGIPIDYGTAEDILKFKPDVVLAGDYSTPMTRRLAHRVGARMVEVKSANSLADARQIVLEVGRQLGEAGRAQALVRQMDAKLARLAADRPARPWRVVAWSGGVSVPGKATLANEVIEAAGAVNVAARPGFADTSFGVEEVLAADPDALLVIGHDAPTLRRAEVNHRVLRRLYGDRSIAFEATAAVCGLPQSMDVAVDLRRQLEALPPRSRRFR